MDNRITEKNIKTILDEGETESIEFKRGTVIPDVLSKCIAAFANTNGGSIIIGLDETKGVVGSTRRDNAIVTRAINMLKPTPQIRVYELECNNKILIVIDIEKSENKFIYCNGALYYREKDRNILMNAKQIEEVYFRNINEQYFCRTVDAIKDMSSTIATMNEEISSNLLNYEKLIKVSNISSIRWGLFFCILSAVFGFILSRLLG